MVVIKKTQLKIGNFGVKILSLVTIVFGFVSIFFLSTKQVNKTVDLNLINTAHADSATPLDGGGSGGSSSGAEGGSGGCAL